MCFWETEAFLYLSGSLKHSMITISDVGKTSKYKNVMSVKFLILQTELEISEGVPKAGVKRNWIQLLSILVSADCRKGHYNLKRCSKNLGLKYIEVADL